VHRLNGHFPGQRALDSCPPDFLHPLVVKLWGDYRRTFCRRDTLPVHLTWCRVVKNKEVSSTNAFVLGGGCDVAATRADLSRAGVNSVDMTVISTHAPVQQ